MASVVLQHLSKSFGKLRVVNDLNLSIEDGQFVVFIGPSGCGKSTTLNMIAGLEDVSKGEILVDGKPVTHLPPKARDMAMVFQNYALYPHMSVFGNMGFGLKMRKTPKEEIKRRVAEAAEILGVTDLLHRKPKELSGGQRQRVALGRAIVRDPRVFLFDEPLSNLDASLRVQMRAELTRLHRRLESTMIYVTHDQVEAMSLADQLVLIEKGVCRQVGTPLHVYNHPANVFVAGFIGSPAMNLVPARLDRVDGGLVLAACGLAANIPQIHWPVCEKLVGLDLIFGIRPEDVTAATDKGGDCVHPMEAEVVEALGSHTLLNLGREGQTFRTSMEPTSSVQVGDTIWVGFNLKRLHLFQAEEPWARLTP
jgi:multiple sugar transport system ATP-binding protein